MIVLTRGRTDHFSYIISSCNLELWPMTLSYERQGEPPRQVSIGQKDISFQTLLYGHTNVQLETHARNVSDRFLSTDTERSVIMHSSFTRSQHKDCCNLQIASEVDNSERCINRENIKLTYITRLSELTRLQMDLICTHINKLISLFTRKINTFAHYKYKYEHNNILLSILFICIYVRVATYLCVYGHTQQRRVWRLDDLCSRFAFLSRACHLPRHESGFSTMTMKCHAGWLKRPIYSVV